MPQVTHPPNSAVGSNTGGMGHLYRKDRPAAPAFVIFEGWVFVLIDPGDLDGMRYDPV